MTPNFVKLVQASKPFVDYCTNLGLLYIPFSLCHVPPAIHSMYVMYLILFP